MSQLIGILSSLEIITSDLDKYIIDNESKLGPGIYDLIAVKAKLHNLKSHIQDEFTEYERRIERYASNGEAENTL